MPNERKYIASVDGICDSDSAPFAVGVNSWVNSENIRTGTTDAGKTEIGESIGSNILISQPQPSVTYLTIGNAPDIENGRILKFQYNTVGANHKIVVLYTATDLEYDVLRSEQVVGGLNFSKDHPIHSARIIAGLLEWTDNLNEPKKININKALKANNPSLPINVIPYNLPMVYPTQTVIKRPPYYSLDVAKSVDAGFPNNYINDQPFQMLYFYEYCDFEWSKLSAYSALIPYGPTEPAGNNFIICKLPFSEPVDDDVQKIYICAKYGNTGKTAYVNVFDKAIAADAAAIIAHNNGTTQLTFNFYNNEIPIALDDVQANTPFDRVPLLAEAFEVARDRNFFGNILVGYDTPIKTSLTGQLVNVSEGGGSFPGEWGYVTLLANFTPPGAQNVYNYPFVYSPTAPQPFYYFPAARVNTSWNGGTYSPDLLPNVNSTDATIGSPSEAAFVSALKFFVYPLAPGGAIVGTPPWLSGYSIFYNAFGGSSVTTVVVFNPSDTANFLKSNGTYNITITFYDQFRRKSGAVNKLIQLVVPQRTISQSVFNISIQWFLDNADAVNEIPDWAYYYMINITKNLTTRFFLQGQIRTGGYVVRAQDGTYTYETTYNIETQYATAFDVTALYALGMGYSFTPGDKINVFLGSGTINNIPIIGQDGNNILFKLTDVGTFSFNAAYEIFTPYIRAENEPYYEASPVYSISNPTRIDRAYSVTSDVLIGDTYNLQRTLNSQIFIAETMSPNDRFWQDWETSTGWINEITSFGQKRLIDQVVFSSTKIQDTQVNGLSEFLATNTKTLPEDCGGIMKLILSSKVEGEQGTVMLAICAGSETASLYLGETRITDATGATQFLGTSTDVIGTINILKGSRGTINPEGVSEYRGDIFFPDANNGVWVQYSLNGLDDIVNKFTRFWSQWFLKYKSLTKEEIEAFGIGNRPFIYSVVDNKHRELLISIPKLSDVPPKGYLPDYPSVIYPFDILDFQAKTIVYKLGRAGILPHYQGSMSFYAENLATLENKLYSFHNGLTYLHNSTQSQNNFYGVQYSSKIMIVSNQMPNVPKVYNNISIESSKHPYFVYFYNEYPYKQACDLVSYDPNWKDYEGIFYATLYRNKLATGVVSSGLLTGEKMRNTAMFILLQFNVYTEPLSLNFIQIGYDVSHGNQNQIQK